MMREDRIHMLREENFRKLLKAGRPEPTQNFTNRIYRTLDRLPDRKPRPALRFMPVSAVAVVAFTAFLVLLIHYAGQGQAPGNGLLAAGGEETETASATDAGEPTSDATTIPTPEPTPEPVETGSPDTSEAPAPSQDATAMPTPCPTPEPNGSSVFMQKFSISSEDNGLMETLLEAGTDGNVLYLRFKNIETPEGKYLSNLKVLVNGIENADDFAAHGEIDAWSVKIPLTVKIDGANADIGVTYTLNEDDGDGKAGATVAQFHFSFILPVYVPDKVSASGSGTIAFGNRAEVSGVYKSMDFVTCSLKAEENESGDLEKYFQKILGRPSQPCDRVLLSGDSQPTAYDIAICKDLVDKDYIDQYVENDAFHMAIYVGDGDGMGHGIYARFLFMVLERAEDGGYLINIINLNPTYRPEKNFTLITKEYTYVDGMVSNDNKVNYAIQVK